LQFAPQLPGPVDTDLVPLPFEKDTDAAVAVPRILGRQDAHGGKRRCILLRQSRLAMQCRAGNGQARPAGSKAPISSRGRPVAGGPVRSPFFSGDLLHDLDPEVAVGNDLLRRAFSCSSCRNRLRSAASSAPKRVRQVWMDALLTDLVLGDLGDRTTVRLAQDGDDLGIR